jgi:hypothetical protein
MKTRLKSLVQGAAYYAAVVACSVNVVFAACYDFSGAWQGDQTANNCFIDPQCSEAGSWYRCWHQFCDDGGCNWEPTHSDMCLSGFYCGDYELCWGSECA